MRKKDVNRKDAGVPQRRNNSNAELGIYFVFVLMYLFVFIFIFSSSFGRGGGTKQSPFLCKKNSLQKKLPCLQKSGGSHNRVGY